MKLKQDEPPGTMAKPATQETQDLMIASWVADMIGIAAELELADFICRVPSPIAELTSVLLT
jgi:hypothetical protein